MIYIKFKSSPFYHSERPVKLIKEGKCIKQIKDEEVFSIPNLRTILTVKLDYHKINLGPFIDNKDRYYVFFIDESPSFLGSTIKIMFKNSMTFIETTKEEFDHKKINMPQSRTISQYLFWVNLSIVFLVSLFLVFRPFYNKSNINIEPSFLFGVFSIIGFLSFWLNRKKYTTKQFIFRLVIFYLVLIIIFFTEF